MIENGHRNLSTATLAKLAEALDVEIADLFPKAEARLWSDDSPAEPGDADLWAAAYAELGESLANRAAEKLAFFAETDRGYIERTFGPQSKTAARWLWIRFEEWISEFSEEVIAFSARARETQKAAHRRGKNPQLELIGPVTERLFALVRVAVDAGKQIALAAFEVDQDAESYERRFQEIVETELRASQAQESFEGVL